MLIRKSMSFRDCPSCTCEMVRPLAPRMPFGIIEINPHYHIDRFKRSAKEVTDPFHNGRKPLWIWIPPKDVTAVQQSSSSSSSAGWVRGILVRRGVFWGGEGRMRCPNKDCICYLHLFTIHFWCLVGCSCTSEMKVKSSWVNNGMKCLPTSAAFQPSKVWYPYFLPKKNEHQQCD